VAVSRTVTRAGDADLCNGTGHTVAHGRIIICGNTQWCAMR
jgi:hypothetical protein